MLAVQAAGPVLAADPAAVAAALQRDAPAAIGSAYAVRRHAPVWLDSNGTPSPAVMALFAAMAEAPDHALPAGRHDPSALASRVNTLDAEDAEQLATLDLDLTAAYLRLAHDLSGGTLEPRRIDRELDVKPVRVEPANALIAIAESRDPAAYLASLEPQSRDYRSLLALFEAMRAPDAPVTWGPAVGDGASLRLGDRSARVGALRARLTALGDHVPEVSDLFGGDGAVVAAVETRSDARSRASTGDPDHFDLALDGAVRRFQARHGLNTDGIVGPATRRALNAEPSDRLRQIAVNLERQRWLNHDLGERHIFVNLAGFTMEVRRGDAVEFQQRVVVGKARRHRTPEFSDEMTHMVVNPRWNVPRSIAREEILPQLQKDPTYLARKNMTLVGSDIPVEEIDWSLVTPSSFPGRVRQNPGPGNALGRVKFMFPNDHAVYLHDTPSRSLFARDVRAYSHGCVRVAKPVEFAHFLLAGQVDDPEASFDRWSRRDREVYVNFDAPLPVHISYRTAWVDADGTVQFRADVYGRDRKVAAALSEAGVATQ